jgi:hypothetical protein
MKRLLLTFTKPSLFNAVYSQKKSFPLKTDAQVSIILLGLQVALL